MNAADRFVFIVGRDALARGGMQALVNELPGWGIWGQSSPDDALERLESTLESPPDLLLWDGAGHAVGDRPSHLDILATILDEPQSLPVLALLDEPEHALPLRSIGVAGLVARDIEPDALASVMQAVAAGFIVLSPALAGQIDSDAIEQPRRPEPNDTLPLIEPLTPRELEVLQLVSQGLPNKTIARELAISENTVKFHMNSILGKLHAQSRTEAVVTAGRAGIIQV